MRCAPHAVSIESAITSRDTSEYFMPSVPIEMPSLTVIVPKVCGIAPDSRSACSARRARRSSPALQGVIVLCALWFVVQEMEMKDQTGKLVAKGKGVTVVRNPDAAKK